MSGRASRDKGKKFEQRCARELSAVTGLTVVTTRSLGATYGADLCTVTAHDNHGRPVTFDPSVLGYSVECKAVVERSPNKWLTQARDQAAPGTTPVVLWLRKYYPFAKGSAFVYDDEAPRGWREMTISEWVAEHLMKETDDGTDCLLRYFD